MLNNPTLIHQLEEGIAQLHLSISSQHQQQLLQFVELLIQWNRSFNLTAIREPEQIITRHLLDSLSIAPYLLGSSILDIGTGAGLPGIPLAISHSEQTFTLLDSNGKKIRFLTQAKISLNLKNIIIVQSRVEDFVPTENFSTLVSRAFSQLPNLLKIADKLLSEQGQLLVMQGKLDKEQLTPLPKPWQIVNVLPLSVPGLFEERHLVIIKRG